MQADQRAGYARSEPQLDHHHPIEHRRDQHQHRADRRLDEADPQDANPPYRPASVGDRHSAAPARTANAATIIPATNKVTPVPLYHGA